MKRQSLRTIIGCVVALGLLPALASCGESAAADLQIERLPDVSPSLPNVPTLPPPPHPVQHADGSYSLYGLRRRQAVTLDTDVAVTGYIVEIYSPPECPEGRTCPTPAAPHMWIADTRGEAEDSDRLMVVGYAENQAQIDEAMELASRGRYEPPDPETGLLPIPTDFFVGNKVKVSGRFARISGTGFNVSEGLLEYRGHETLEQSPEAQAAAAPTRRR
ncbi:MAG: hypothetical protein M3Y87_14255 [Myxococcota bacterium]|nr:hypothetical protein [Myxococcota bacterium]